MLTVCSLWPCAGSGRFFRRARIPPETSFNIALWGAGGGVRRQTSNGWAFFSQTPVTRFPDVPPTNIRLNVRIPPTCLPACPPIWPTQLCPSQLPPRTPLHPKELRAWILDALSHGAPRVQNSAIAAVHHCSQRKARRCCSSLSKAHTLKVSHLAAGSSRTCTARR